MAKVGSWSTTPGSNNSAPPDGWPEGQAPSTINDCARQMMADIRTLVSDLQFVDLNNTPSFLTATTFSLGAADVSNFTIGRRIKLFDGTTQYGTIDSVSATFVSVRLDPGYTGLTASLSSVAVAATNAVNHSIPDQFKVDNAIINGGMDIAQRNASLQCTNGASNYTVDRFVYLQSAAAAVNMSQKQSAPAVTGSGRFLYKCLALSVSAADASMAAGEFGMVAYAIEGYDWRKVGHQPGILEFQVATNRTGVYCVALRNSGGDQSFVQNYTVSAAGTWTHFAITCPAAPTTGTWNYSNGAGLIISFALGAGTTYQATNAGAWSAANLLATASQTNWLGTVGNTFHITDVAYYPAQAVTAVRSRHHQAEMEACQRYCWRGLPFARVTCAAYTVGANMSFPIQFPVQMRTTPTLTASVTVTNAVVLVMNTPAPVANPTPDGFTFFFSATSANTGASFDVSATSFVMAEAEIL